MLERQTPDPLTVTVGAGTDTATGTAINFRNFAGGTLSLPAANANTSIAWYESPDGSDWYPLYDGAGTAVASTVSDSAKYGVKIPDACFGCAFLMALGNVGAIAAKLTLKG
jgi:hypothetical protein